MPEGAMQLVAEPDIEEELDERLDEELETEETVESMWRVLVHNDDFTPYEFVIFVLRSIFGLSSVAAELITYAAHTSGMALVAILPKTEAQRRVGKAHFAAQLEGYPLTFTIEPE